MSIQWKYSSPVEESKILAVAKKHNITLPSYLIQMIMEGNNGSPTPKSFSMTMVATRMSLRHCCHTTLKT